MVFMGSPQWRQPETGFGNTGRTSRGTSDHDIVAIPSHATSLPKQYIPLRTQHPLCPGSRSRKTIGVRPAPDWQQIEPTAEVGFYLHTKITRIACLYSTLQSSIPMTSVSKPNGEKETTMFGRGLPAASSPMQSWPTIVSAMAATGGTPLRQDVNLHQLQAIPNIRNCCPVNRGHIKRH